MNVSIILFCSQTVDYTDSILDDLLQYVQDKPDHELVVVLDGHLLGLHSRFQEKLAGRPQVTLLRLHTPQGQVATIRAGIAVARGRWLVTYPAYPQVDPSSVAIAVRALEGGLDYVVACRTGRLGSPLERMASRTFNRVVKATTGVGFRDLACGLHGMRAAVGRAIPNYGDNQLFLPILLAREGYRIGEAEVPATTKAPARRFLTPATLVRRGLDILTLSYLVRFTQKPLRPFGALGVVLTAIGIVLSIWLVIERFALGRPLAERPMLLLALLLVTTGVQVVILGFLGELLVYLHFRDEGNYRVQERIEDLSDTSRRSEGRGA